jgi:exonuclease SbcC
MQEKKPKKMKLVVKNMRPRYLEIEGLQSFKELQKVDFDKLSETGLFGIFGPTGSGKSTILDAITLALYGTVQRAAKGTQGIMNTETNILKVAYTFDLTKEGNKRTFRVERQYKRKKDSESSIEAKIVRLLEISGEHEAILVDKHSDVNNYIVQLVGLKFEDFTRSVVLPQNKFQEFLLSPRNEKTKMLERIFYLEEFGRRLVDKVNREMSAIKNKLSNIEGALSTLGISSPEALIDSETKMVEAQKLKAICANKLKVTEESYAKGMERYKLSKELEELQKKLEEYKGKQAEIQKLEEICLKSDAANAIKPIMIAYKEAKQGFSETNISLSSLELQLKTLEIEKTTVQQSYDSVAKLKDQGLPELIKYNTMLQECGVLQGEMEELTKLLEAARKEYAEISVQMEDAKKDAANELQKKEDLSKKILELEHEAEEQQVDNDRRKLVNQGSALEKELQGLEATLKKQTEKYNSLHSNVETYQAGHNKTLEELNKVKEMLVVLNNNKADKETTRPIDRDEISKQNTFIAGIEGLLQNITSSYTGVQSLEMRVKEYVNQGLKIGLEIEKTEESLKNELIEEADKTQQLNELLKQQRLHTSAILAKSLKEGEKCPVCGSLEHPELAVDIKDDEGNDLEQKQNELQSSIAAKQKLIREIEHEAIKLKQQHSSLMQVIDQDNIELQSRHKEYQNYRQQLPGTLEHMEQEQIREYIRVEKEALDKAVLEYAKWEEEMQQLKVVIKEQESALSEIKVQEGRLAALLDNTKATLIEEHNHLEDYNKAYIKAAATHQEMKQHLGIDNFLTEADIIVQKDEKTQGLAVVIKQSRGKLETLTIAHQLLLEKINSINEILNEKKAEGIKLREQKEEKKRKITNVIGEKNLQVELEKVIQEMDALENAYKNTLEELNKVRTSLEEIQRRKAGLQSSFEHYKQKVETDRLVLQEALKDKGFSDEAQVEQCMLEDDKIKLYQEEIVRYKREKSSTEDRLQSISKQLGGKLLDEQQWQQLCEEYEMIKLELENCISKLEEAKNNYKQIKESFEKWIKLQEEQKIISKKKDMLEQIQKLLKGNGFIEFISEERMRYIAREASETLGELTKFRYSIELDSENGFVIRDNANGGVLRSVASLSGGETFLTSLSLALALSSQLQLKGQSPLEFFFLDEGFGTLDNTLLDTVIDSLERLSSRKRIIGLISHVPELKSRINRRLIVEAPNREGKGSRISIEKA